MTQSLSGPSLSPALGGKPRQLVVLLHGYGADGDDLIGIGAHWQELLPHALFVSPHAPEICDVNPGGFQWFALDLDRPESRVSGTAAGRAAVAGLLEALWAETGLGARQTLLVGFSQGAMMALHVGLSLEEPLLGIIAFAGALILPDGFEAGNGPKPPICLVHGDRDGVVDPGLSADAARVLKARGFEVSYHVSPRAGHTITLDGLGFASAFIAGLSATL